ncbi:MAG: helix-turn-helix transcriptional regulator [Eubacterium sp.]|nr:helix-turn-helix transcriptional regulator [Eubacterium sp.]
MREFGNRLRTLRKQKNLTQKQLASQIGVKNSIISFYEMGDRLPSPEIIVKLAAIFHVSADFLMGIDKKEVIDISDLNEDDKMVIRLLIDSLKSKSHGL